MLRVTIDVDSATPQEVYDLTLAFQRTAGIPGPRVLTEEPTVTVGGSAMGWKSPPVYEARAAAILREYEALRDERTTRALALNRLAEQGEVRS